MAEQETAERLVQIGRLVDMGLGGQIVAGTDAGCYDFSFGHIDYALHLMVAGGMSPMSAIMAATSISARACGVDDQVGSLEPGKVADIVLVRGDPLADIDRAGDVEAVFQRGSQISGQLLAPALTSPPATEAGPTVI